MRGGELSGRDFITAPLVEDLEPLLSLQTEAVAPESGERRLLRAVLEDALAAIYSADRARSTEARRWVFDARAWIEDDEDWGFMSFVSLCRELGFDPARVRRSVGLALADARTAVPRMPKRSQAVETALRAAERKRLAYEVMQAGGTVRDFMVRANLRYELARWYWRGVKEAARAQAA